MSRLIIVGVIKKDPDQIVCEIKTEEAIVIAWGDGNESEASGIGTGCKMLMKSAEALICN